MTWARPLPRARDGDCECERETQGSQLLGRVDANKVGQQKMGGRLAPPELRLRHSQNSASAHKLQPAEHDLEPTQRSKGGEHQGLMGRGGEPEVSRSLRDENCGREELREQSGTKRSFRREREPSGREGKFPPAEVEGRAFPDVPGV